MAVRSKPGWDMSLSEIQKRADALKVSGYFEKQRTDSARADAASHAADREILRAAARNLTVDQVMAYSAAVARGENPNVIDFIARADAVATGDGLRKITHVCPETGRKTYEFENTGERKRWMLDFASPAYEMLRICQTPQTPEQNARFEADRIAIAESLRNGTLQLPEL